MLQEAIQKALIELSKLYPEFNIEDEHNKDTARRISNVWMEMCKGYNPPDFDFTTFKNKYPSQPIVLKDIPFSSFCKHHFLPFYGKAHIGYLPGDKICGLSKLPRVVEYFASKPQVQEELGNEIVTYLGDNLDPILVIVLIEAEHTCVACRGVKSVGGKMITKAMDADYKLSIDNLKIGEQKLMELLKDGL